jgi:hypothetical protein
VVAFFPTWLAGDDRLLDNVTLSHEEVRGLVIEQRTGSPADVIVRGGDLGTSRSS